MKPEINNRKKWKIHKYIEIKECSTKQSMESNKNANEKSTNILKLKEMNNNIKTCGIIKTVLRENLYK